MYKLLTTTAVILAVATPSLANQWTGGKALTQKLETVYNGVDGQTEFGALQGDGGELANFFGLVDKGVTYITLSVDPTTNNISTGINEGVAFSTITDSRDDLVNRVNFDLFKQDSASTETHIKTYDSSENYTTVNTVLNGDASNTSANDYSQTTTQGLVGRKIDKLITEVNAVNDFLIDSNTSDTQSKAFITAYNGDGTGVFGGDLGVINGHIDGFNTSINAASDFVWDNTDPDNPVLVSGTLFANLPIDGLNETNINDFLIPAYNSATDIGNANLGHSSISNWANGIYNYATANGGSGTFTSTSTEPVSIDVAANTVTFGGTTYSVAADGTLS